MARPREYENLIATKAFEEVSCIPGAAEGFLKNAADDLEVLEHYEVRTKDAGRNLAILRVAADLNLDAGEIRLVSDAHARRNATTYRSPFPPISRAEAQAMIVVLEKVLPRAHVLTGVPAPDLP